jgi:hypothetical protein
LASSKATPFVARISDKSARVVLARLVTDRIDIIGITTMISIGSHHLDEVYLDILPECRGVCSERKNGKEISQIKKETVLVMDWCY